MDTSLRVRLPNMEDKLDEIHKKLQNLEKEKETWIYTENHLKEQNKESKEKLKAMQIALSESRLEIKKREELLKQQQSKEEKQKSEASQLQKERKIFLEKNEKLKEEIKSLDLQTKKGNQLTAIINEKSFRITELEQENIRLRNVMPTAIKENEKVFALSLDLKEEVKVLQYMVTSEMFSSQKLQEKLAQVENQNKEMHQSLQQQIKLIESQKIIIADELQYSMQMRLKLKELQETNELLQKEKNNTDKKFEELEDEMLSIEEKENIIDRLINENSAKEKEIFKQRQEVEKLKQRVEDLISQQTKDIEQIKKKIAEEQRETQQSLQEENLILKDQLKICENQLEQANLKNALSKDELMVKNEEIEDIIANLKSQCNKINSDLDTAKKDNGILNERLENLIEQNQDLDKENSALKLENEEKQQTINDLSSELQHLRESSNNERSNFHSKIEELKNEIEEKAEVIKESAARTEELEGTLSVITFINVMQKICYLVYAWSKS